MNVDSLPPALCGAIAAAQDKKAVGVTVLCLAGLGAFSDYLMICSAESTRQIAAIGDAIEEATSRSNLGRPHREGRDGTEWLLLDFGSLVVNIFSQRAREFYDIERLWRGAKRLDIDEPGPVAARGIQPA